MGRLLIYDLMIAWKGARAAFSTKRDLLLLLVAVPTSLLLAAEGGSNAVAAMRDMPEPGRPLLVAVAGCFVNLAVGRRLLHLQTESILARGALRRGAAIVYRLSWNALPFIGSVSIMTATLPPPASASRVAALIVAYLIGAGAGALISKARHQVRRVWGGRCTASSAGGSLRLPGESRRQRIAALITARTGLVGPSLPLNAMLFAALGAVILLLYRISSGASSASTTGLLSGIAALAVMLAFGLLLRQHPPLFRYLLYLGVEPIRPALVPAAAACSMSAGFVLTAAAMKPDELVALSALAAAAVFLFIFVAMLRALHFATKTRSAAELAIQVDSAGIVLVAFVVLPLAPATLVVRLLMLRHRARSAKYLMQ